jgi:hypothetical protein
VNINGTFASEEEAIALLKERTRRLDPEERTRRSVA